MKFTNFGELKRNAEIEPRVMSRMKVIRKSESLYEKVKQLFSNASESKNDPEDAYILFNRCNHVCNLMLGCPDFNTFRSSVNASRFYQIFDCSLTQVEALEKQLISMYDDIAVARLQQELDALPVIQQPELHPIDQSDFGNFIKPKQLIDYVEKQRKIVLILDYRIDKDPIIKYSDTNFIRILPLETNLIAPGLVFTHMRLYIDFRYRPIINEIQNYDLVVLLGDELEHPNATPFKDGTKTRYLLDAITVYNFNSQLKRKPLLLEGGFRAWENAYPMYIKRLKDHRESQESLNYFDEFTNLVQLVKQNLGSELTYPELLSNPIQPAAPRPVTISRPISPPASSQPRIVPIRRISPPPIPKLKPAPPTPPKPTPSTMAPSTDQTSSSSTNSTEFSVIPNVEPVAYNNKNEFKAEEKLPKPQFDRKLPQVLTLGGARMDVSNSTPAPIVPSRPVQPPPIPERPSKPYDPATQQTLLNIAHIYDRATYLIDQNAARDQVPPAYTGLVNLGNTCFMNSALQALFNTPGMRNIFGQKKFTSYINPQNKSSSKGMISACFSSLLDSVWSTRYRYIQPDNFLNVFAREVNSHLADRTQHDSQEFLSLLVDALHEETNRVDVKKPFEQNYDGKNIQVHAEHYIKNLHLFASSPINDIFGLKSISQLTCLTCNKSSVTFCDNPLTFLEMPVDNGEFCSLRQCLKHSFGEDYLDGDHKWKCPSCKHPQRTLRSSRIWSLPPVLVICLKRFAMKNGDFVKNSIDVNFDIKNLDLTPYIHKDASMNLKPNYQLYALTNHEGTLNSGHYTSIIHNAKTNRWLKYDDDRVSEIDPESIQSRKAYILFYRNVGL